MGNYNAGRGFRQMKGMDKMIKTKPKTLRNFGLENYYMVFMKSKQRFPTQTHLRFVCL